MLLWFVGTSMGAMWMTFRDPAIDHRVIVLGALLPDAVDVTVAWALSFGGSGFDATAGVMHALIAPVGLLGAVMLLTIGRRSARRRWLALPIGVFWHLVFDGAWTSAAVFGWPLVDPSGLHSHALFVASRPAWANVAMEIAGLALAVWLWRTWGLGRAGALRHFVSTGRLGRTQATPGSSRSSSVTLELRRC